MTYICIQVGTDSGDVKILNTLWAPYEGKAAHCKIKQET